MRHPCCGGAAKALCCTAPQIFCIKRGASLSENRKASESEKYRKKKTESEENES
jgi:hypothetical protein